MVLYGPSPVTATAVALVKNIACKILELPQGRVLQMPKAIATPNRIQFELQHPSLPLREDQSLVDLRQQIDKEVNRMIRADIPVNVYRNLTLSELLHKFGEDVIDRYYDIDESNFAKWLFAEYESIMGKPIWNNGWEKRGPTIWKKRYENIEGIEIDQKESLKAFLSEIGGEEIDLLHEKSRSHFLKKRHWMRSTGQIPTDLPDNVSEFELVSGKKWTHNFGIFERITNTDYSKASENIKFSAFEIDGVGVGMCLPNHYSRHWNSENIQSPMNYLASTKELGKIVIYQMRQKRIKMRTLRFNVDVFPGYNSEIIGANPYTMFRETFDIKHLASIIPDDHDLYIPKLATPIDFNAPLIEDDGRDDESEVDMDTDDDMSHVHQERMM